MRPDPVFGKQCSRAGVLKVGDGAPWGAVVAATGVTQHILIIFGIYTDTYKKYVYNNFKLEVQCYFQSVPTKTGIISRVPPRNIMSRTL